MTVTMTLDPAGQGICPACGRDLAVINAQQTPDASADLLAAAELLEKAEEAHANCEECDGEGAPEACPVCFPLFDDARIARRLAIAKAKP